MSAFKKVISIVLCFAMLLGTVAVAGDLVAPKASAAEGTSNIKTYAELAEKYDNFIYMGTEAYETVDGELELSDGYVQPGDKLTFRFYLKSDRYIGSSTVYQTCDFAFFDNGKVTNGAVASSGYTVGKEAVTNSEHPMIASRKTKFYTTSDHLSEIPWVVNQCGIDTTELEKYGSVSFYTESEFQDDFTMPALRLNSDLWMMEFYLTVREGLADGTKGVIKTEPYLWAAGTGYTPNALKQSTVDSLPAPATEDAWDDAIQEYECLGLEEQVDTINALLFDDLYHEFIIGENPADGGSDEPITVTSNIKSYAELAEKYDNFIYMGTEAYETVDGELELSDGYVQPGDKLTFRFYLKSDRYIGSSTVYQTCDFAFFDNGKVTNGAVASSGYTVGKEAVTNSEHPMIASRKTKFYTTSDHLSEIPWVVNQCGIDTTELEKYGSVSFYTESEFQDDFTMPALRLNSDLWMMEFYLTVREGLADGTKGVIKTEPYLWAAGTGYEPNALKQSTVDSLPAPATEDAWDDAIQEYECLGLEEQVDTINALLFDDLYHEFTIGEPGSGVKKYTAKFVENDGSTVVSDNSYEKGAAVTAPEAVANQLGWANESTGKLVDFSDYTMPARDVTFRRVLTTDKFDLVIDLDGGTVDASKLPADVTDNGNGTLTAKVPLNGSFDLSTIPAPEKAGYTATWEPATVTVDSIKGAQTKAVWEANTYKVSFYANKGDAEPYTVVDAVYGEDLTVTIPTDAFDKKLGAWMDFDTDSEACTVSAMGTSYYARFGTFAGTSDKSYYAKFTDFDSSISFMIRDYAAADLNAWVPYSVKYNDKGNTLSVNAITAIVNDLKTKEGLSVSSFPGQSTKYYMYSEPELQTLVDTTKGIGYDGAKVIYIETSFAINVTWKVPVFDEATAAYTDSFNENTVTLKSLTKATSAADEKSIFAVNAKVPTALKYDPAAGYKFDGWFDEEGNPYTYDSYWGITLPYGTPENVVLTAKYSETEYDVILSMNNGDSPDTLKLDGVKVGIGDSLNVDGATLINTSTDEEVEHPVVDVENSEQPVVYRGMNGYKFVGWSTHKKATADDIIKFPIDSLTYETVKTTLLKGNITLYAVWEALEYDLVLMYDTPESNPKGPFEDRIFAEPLTFKVKTGDTIETYTKSSSTRDLAIESAPEGFNFYDWCQKNGATITDSKMPAYGATYYANYTSRVIKVYIDYNHGRVDEDGNPVNSIQLSPLSQSSIKDNWLYYGEDFERKADEEAGIKQGAGPAIRNTYVTDSLRPGENYEIVGWTAYHVKNEEDVYDQSKWIKGVNDEGSNIAKDTIVYQIKWKHHSEFLFRIYDTDKKLCKALGKDLKMYYWKNYNYATRKEAQVNTQPDLLIVFFYTPTFENWDASRFFDLDMWRSISLRFDPFAVPKSSLTPQAILAFLKMIPELIKNLING